MRLDKFLSGQNIGSRSQVKEYIRQGLVAVNGKTAADPQMKVAEESDAVTFRGVLCSYRTYHYYMLNKPNGVVSATADNTCQTVADLLHDTGVKDLFPVGRLDKDTEGLVLMTDDGPLAHRLLSPRKHVDKTYLVETATSLTGEQKALLMQGVDIGEKNKTMPAEVLPLSPNTLLLTIREGKYHQIKRMLIAVGNQVTHLKRLRMGSLQLDETLPPGGFRELTEEEIRLLRENS